MISDSDVEAAIQSLIDNADDDARKVATRLYVTEFRKHLKGIIMKENTSLPIGAQEREAYASLRYQEHLDAMRTAAFEDSKARFLREGAEAKIRAWQTQESTRRTLKV